MARPFADRGRRGPPLGTMLLLASLVTACARRDAPPRALDLRQFQQEGSRGVCLDETLTFHFSEPLERTSVTSSSVRILDELGRPAAGRLRVDERRITFTPRLPLRPDLSDGGLRPGTEYRVELAGFPRPDGLRSQSGLPLRGPLRLGFRTAAVGGSSPLFVGTLVERGPWLHVPRQEPGPLDPIEVVCRGEGIDPTSLGRGEFAIAPREAREAGGGEDAGTIELVPSLLENRADGARLALHPVRGPAGAPRPLLDPGEWFLARVGSGLRSLGGRAVIEVFAPPLPQVVVQDRSHGRERLRFEGASRRWDEEPPGFDGTAYWPDRGAPGEPDERDEADEREADRPRGVSLRFPAAAGDGADGPRRPLRSWPTGPARENDLHATEILIEAGDLVDLGATAGAIVLRAQGSIEIAGRLVRGVAGSPERPLEEELTEQLHVPAREWGTVSDWLARSQASPEPWTVLVAGGEIRIPGHVEVAGPLMLVAGGWVRITGYVGASSVWKSPEGRRNVLRVHDVPLRIDPPSYNRLRRPLTLGVLTHAIRPARGVVAWGSATILEHRGGGDAWVRFVGLRDDPLAGSGVSEYEPVADLAQLDGCEAVRLLLGVSMPAGQGEPWDPPRIEEVELSWIGR